MLFDVDPVFSKRKVEFSVLLVFGVLMLFYCLVSLVTALSCLCGVNDFQVIN